jgi:hypothetical protein
LKQFDESVPQTLGEILIRHGLAPLTDAKLCENLLKDYCGAFKEEISLLVLAVRERVASDLLVSQDGLQRDLLRGLLVKRLRKGRTLNQGDARWAVESWARAIRAFSRAESKLVTNDLASINEVNPSNPWPRSGPIEQFSKAVRAIAVSPLSEMITCGGDDGIIYLLQANSTNTLKQCEAPVSALAFSPNGVLIAAASGPTVELVDLHSREAVGPDRQTAFTRLLAGWQKSRFRECGYALRDTSLEFANRADACFERRMEWSTLDRFFTRWTPNRGGGQ